MKKPGLKVTLAALAIVGFSTGSSLAAMYAFEDVIDNWNVRGTTYDSVYIDQDPDFFNLFVPNTVASPFSYSHDLTQEVDFLAGDRVTEAWLALDFTDMDLAEFGNPDGFKLWGLFKYDKREFVSYSYDAGTQSFTEINENNDTPEHALTIDWLNDDGMLDVTIYVKNGLGTGDIGLDSSRVYGYAEPIPEPATMLLFGTGIAGLAALRQRRK